MNSIINWLEQHLQPCFYREILGFECPGCGMQRSLIELLKGNFIQSLKLYPALIPIIILFIFLILHISFNFKKVADILKYMFIGNISIIMISYFIKLFN
mgnify:FL=1